MFILFQILICFFLHLPLGSLGFDCLGPIDPAQGFSYGQIESNITGRVSQAYAKIRIKLFFDRSIEDKPYKGLVQKAADFWANVLSVKPISGRIFKRQDCLSEKKFIYKALDESSKKEKYCLNSCAKVTKCGDFVVPIEHLDACKYYKDNSEEYYYGEDKGPGIENVDLVFYVSAINSPNCQQAETVAYAGTCDLEPVLDRTLFAHVNVCPNKGDKYSNDDKAILRTIKHEMLHPLGFRRRLFIFFRDKEGNPLRSRDENGQPLTTEGAKQSVWKEIERDWHVRGQVIKTNRTFSITPKVVREVRSHFGCDKLEGAELENFGSKGTKFSHLEARVFFDDEMVGNMNTGKGLFSRIDFAVLDDSGWYQVDYSQADKMDFGHNLGCDFCMKSCKYWMDKRRSEGGSVEPFCDQTEEQTSNYTCNKIDKVYSACPLRRGEKPAAKEYQYFDKIEGVNDTEVQLYSGLDKLADFCPIPIYGLRTSCTQESEMRIATLFNPKSNIALENFGTDSFCFESRRKWIRKEYHDRCSEAKRFSKGQNAGCYNYLCLSGLLVVEIQSRRFPCFYEGQVIEINIFGLSGNGTHEGTIVCPKCEQMCGQSTDFECKPENMNFANKYPYPKDECTDDEYLQKMMTLMDKDDQKLSNETNPAKGTQTISSNTPAMTEFVEPITLSTSTMKTLDNKGSYMSDEDQIESNQSSKLAPCQLVRTLLVFVLIKIFC